LGAATFAVGGGLEEIAAVDIRTLPSLLRGKAPDMVISAVSLETGVLPAKLASRLRVSRGREKTAWILRPTPPGYRTSGGVGWLAGARFS
jgi:hypothetical protein